MTVRFLSVVAFASILLSSCAATRIAESRAAPAEKRAPNAWLLGQRLSAGPMPARAVDVALENAAAEGKLALGPGTWAGQGPFNIGGRLTTLGVDPVDANRLWVGSAAGGVFESTDGGTNWSARFDGQPSMSIGSLVTHPTLPGVVYVGTGEDNGGGYSFDGDGIWKTTDGGQTWQNVGLGTTRRIGKMAIDPTDGNRVFAAAGGNWFARDAERGIYRTTDGGQTWQKVLYVSDDTGGIDVAIDPSDPNRVYAAMWQRLSQGTTWYVGGTSGGIWRSLDGGTTWAKLAGGLPTGSVGRIGLAIAPSQTNTVYACIIGSNGSLQGIYKSTNAGDVWTKTSGSTAPLFFSTYSYYFSQIRVDPASPTTIYALDVNLLRSTNSGSSLAPIATSVHSDWHDLRVEPGGRWLASTDGGFFKSASSGSAWTHATTLPVSQLYDVAVAPTNTLRRFAGLQDNFVDRTITGGSSDWTSVIGGDGLQVEVDPTDANKVYGESQYGAIQRSIDGGATFADATSGISTSERTNWNTPIAVDAIAPATLFTGTVRVYRSSDSAVTWTPISPNLTNGSAVADGLPPNWKDQRWRDDRLDHLEDLIDHTITVVSVSRADNRVVWAGTDDGNVWVTTDAGANWSKVNPPGAAYWVTDIAPDPRDRRAALLTVTGYRTGDKLPYLRATRDLGASWTELSSGLPQLPLNTVIADADWSGRIFVGSDTGVHWSDDGGASWSLLRTGMPSVVVMELNVTAPTHTLWAGTHARGIYSYDLAQLPAVADGDADGVDNNADCALADGGAFAIPGEVPSLTVAKDLTTSAQLTWPSLASTAGAGTVYDIARGDLATLGASGTGAAASLACGVAGTGATDAGVPPPDSGVYYLVRARNSCGAGTWGRASSGSERVVTACP